MSHATRIGFSVLVGFSVLILLLFVVMRLRTSYTNEIKIAGLEREIQALNYKLEEHGTNYTSRLSDLENVVYGELEPHVAKDKAQPTARTRVVEAWSRNRDAVLQKRLSELERRLLQLEPPR